MRSIVKELFIMALLLMIVVFIIGMIFYEYMPNNKTVPEPITYVADSTTTAVLQEISTAVDIETESGETESVIKSYSISAKDLSAAASKQSYTSGKTNPFAEYSEVVNGDANTTNSGNASTNTTTNSTAGTTSQKSDSTGTFFENKNSK